MDNKNDNTLDALDLLKDQWQHARPELDGEMMALFGRMARLNNHLSQAIQQKLKTLGFSHHEFDVLATLRRSGPPYRLTPTRLYQASMLSSGAMTNRLDKLEERGLIVREHSVSDRRSIEVALTEEGFAAIDGAMGEHVENEQQLAETLTLAEQQQLNTLLKKWLRHFE